MYGYTRNLLPESFDNLWVTNLGRHSDIQLLNIRAFRDDHLLFVPFVRLEHYCEFPLAKYPRDWYAFIIAVI
jgi:hypothetical protein